MGRGLDVVIPTHDTRSLTLRCVAAVTAAAPKTAVPVRCIVVDNASRDGTADAIVERFPAAAVVRSDVNLGYGGAVNLGAASGDGHLLLVLNSDVFPRRDALASLVAFAEAHPAHVAAGGRLVDVGTSRPQVGFAVRSYPTLAQQLALLVGLERYAPWNPVSRRARAEAFDYDRTQDLELQPAGASLLVRRADFEAVRGFDDRFFFWFEDVDLLLRLRERGPIAYVHDAVFEHVGGGSWRRWARPQVILSRYRSLLRFFDTHHSRREALALRIAVGALAALRALVLQPVARDRAAAYREVVRMALGGTRT